MGRLPATHSTVVSLWRDRLNIDYQLTLADLSFTEFATLTNCLEQASSGFEVISLILSKSTDYDADALERKKD